MAKRRNPHTLRPFTFVAKAVADETRIRILAALRGHELCVCQIVELLGLAPSTVSKHLSILRQAYLVDSRKEGRWTRYSRSRAVETPVARAAIEWIDGSLAGDAVLGDDARRLKGIVRIPLEEICNLPDRS